MPCLLTRTYLLLVMLLLCAVDVTAGERYVDNRDGTITDIAQGIMWQRKDDGVERSWQEAISYCDSLELAGNSDWTLPTESQLEALISTAYSPTIDPLFSVKPSYYWSSTESRTSVNSARYVNFYYGNTYTYSKDNPYYALCVRTTAAALGKGLTAVFAGEPVTGKPLAIHFTATISGGVEPYFYEWDFGDGSTAGAHAPTHLFAKEGTYTVLLTVSDNDGAVSAARQEISLPLLEVPVVEAAGAMVASTADVAPDLSVTVPTGAGEAPPGASGVPRGEGTAPLVEETSAYDAAPKGTEEGGARPTNFANTSYPPLASPRGAMVANGSGLGQPIAGGVLGHGLLSYSFANAMAGDGDWDKNGTVTASEMQAYLDQGIKSLSKGQQMPLISREGDDFPICASQGTTYVMAIGISHDLTGAPLVAGQDAELVRKAVEDTCSRTKTMMLTGRHANRQEILQGLVQIGSMITKDDTLLLYIGAANGVDNGRLNWYVDDSTRELPWFTGIFHDDLVQFVKTLPVDHIVVLGEKN